MRAMLTLGLLACLFAARATATVGGDISEAFSDSVMHCVRNTGGWDFMIVRSYHSYGSPDPNAGVMLSRAAAAGIPYRDIYHFPCRSKDAAHQVREDIDAVGAGNFGQIWFDIETNGSPGCGWSGDKGSNCQFLADMINAAKAKGKSPGVYASQYMWDSIMGSGCTAGHDNGAVLWYAHYDGRQSFSDYVPFGGWAHPNVKQYGDSVPYCGISADADWYP